MFRKGCPVVLRTMLAGLVGISFQAHGFIHAGEEKTVPPGTPVTIVVKPAEPATPPVSITLGSRQGTVTPNRTGCTHTGGGNVDVQQPSSDTVVVTMTGVAVAYNTLKGSSAAMVAELNQCFEVSFDNPRVKKAKLTMEGRVIGALRSHSKGGAAEFGDANAAILADAISLLHLSVTGQSACGGDSQSVNLREGPVTVPVLAGKYKLHQTFRVAATSCQSLCGKAPSAEFAPDALDPLWISYKEPFKGVSKKDFGFQVTIKVSDDTPAEPEKPENNKKTENNPNPTK